MQNSVTEGQVMNLLPSVTTFCHIIHTKFPPIIVKDENHDIAIAMSPSRADPVLPWLGVFKCLYQSHCTDWGHLNV